MRTVARSSSAVRPLVARAVLAAVACGLAAGAADAQYFGRNKVQWEDFDFHVMETEHFLIHHYPAGNPAIADASQMAERWYQRLSATFGHEFAEKKPLVLYNDHADFQQTGTTGGLIGEGTGGFTEPLQDRVVLPLTSTYADTDHVIGHELVHSFQFDIAARQARRSDPNSAGAPGLMRLPLWMVEGLAEYLSQGRVDTLTATWLRDAVLKDDLPDLQELTRDLRYNPYQYGQAVWAYVGGRYGDRRAVELFRAALQLGPEEAFREALGLDWKQFSEEWHADLRKHYQPLLADRAAPDAVGRELIGRREGGRMSLAPALSPDGRFVAFLSTRELFSIDLFLADAQTGEVLRRLASEDSDPHIDALRFIDSAGSWSPDGRRFAFSVIARGDNHIVVVDVASGDVERRIDPSGVGEITNIAWSPDGRTLAFSGMSNGISDIYLLELDGERLRKLTDDRHGDLQPAWTPDGRSVVFVSDRGEGLDPDELGYAPLALFRVDVAGGAVTALPRLAGGRQIDPHVSPDGAWLYFLADPDGFTDVYRMPLAGGPAERLTRIATGVGGITDKSPALSVSQQQVVFSVFDGRDLRLRALPAGEAGTPAPASPDRQAAVLPPAEPRRDVVVSEYLTPGQGPPPPPESFELRPYAADLKLTYVGPVSVGLVSDDYGYGVGGGATAYFSDVLGRHELAVALQGGSTTGSFSDAIALQALYLDRSDRLTWGVGGAHLPYQSAFTFVSRQPVDVGGGQTVIADVIEQQRETITLDQASLIGQYPLSQTRRFEATGGYTRYGFEAELERIVVVGNTVIERETFDLTTPGSLNLWNGGVAYVGDNSQFGFVSPVRGGRMRLELEQTGGDLAYSTALADLRKYFWARPVTFAFRGLHFGRYGDDAESGRLSPLYVGRETLVRGYAVGDIDPSECTTTPGSDACPEFDRLIGSRMAVVNFEARVPLFGVEEYGLVELPSLPTELGVFVDGGAAWSSGESPDLRFDEDTADRVPVWSAGVTLRMLLLGALPLEFYYAKPFQRPAEDWVFGFLIAPGW